MDFFDNDILNVILRSLISITTLFLITKILGKKQVSELSLFDYVIGISIGNFATEMSINLESDFFNAMIAIVLFGLIAYFISILTMKSLKMRKFFVGTPTILIQNGKMLYENMQKTKFDVKGEYKPLTIKDMNLKVPKQGLCANVIIDGNIMNDNLNVIGKDEEWLLHELKVKGKKVNEILLATVDINDKVVIYDKFHNEKVNRILE